MGIKERINSAMIPEGKGAIGEGTKINFERQNNRNKKTFNFKIQLMACI